LTPACNLHEGPLVNVTRLFLEKRSSAALIHEKSAHSSVSRTWDQLHDNVARLVRSLNELGIRAGDRILIVGTSRVEVIECILAAFNLGAAAMPVAPAVGRATLASIARNMKPACCIFEDAADTDALESLSAAVPLIIHLDDAPELGPRGHSYRRLVERPEAGLEFRSFPDEHPALVIHSSGSTGTPKVIVLTHGALVRYFEHHDLVWRQYTDAPDSLGPSSGALVTGLPVTHLAGLSICLQALLNGRHSYLLGAFTPLSYLKLIERSRSPCPLLVPSMYRALLNEAYLQQMDRSALRCCILIGEPCPMELLRRIEAAFGVPAVLAYSMTECLSGIGHSRRQIFAQTIKPGSCGRQLFGELALRDEKGTLREDFGELWIRNETVHPCYLDPAMNEARLRGGWFRTGAVASMTGSSATGRTSTRWRWSCC
jgi:fatty-acyl-CoA synthase